MSYVATITGADLTRKKLRGVAFVPAEEAQEYLRALAPSIAKLDGSPVYLYDDCETGTSDVLVVDAEDPGLDRWSLDGTTLVDLLRLCESKRCVLRVWCARGGDPFDVTECVSQSESALFILARAHRSGALRFAPWACPSTDRPTGPLRLTVLCQ